MTGSTTLGRGKIKKGAEAPIFLRKTYAMIDTCDPSYACWSEKGDTFTVKNPEAFARDIIPQFFKHNKFASFVRQLNFYGFRKIKTESILVSDEMSPTTPEYRHQRFRHEKFLRGRPDLLIEIRKLGQNQNQPIDPEEVSALKDEVKNLKTEVGKLKRSMEEMVGFVKVVTEQQQKQTAVYPTGPPTKRMKLSQASPDLVSSTNLGVVPLPPSFPFSLPSQQSSPLHHVEPDNVSSQQQVQQKRYQQVERTPVPPVPPLPSQLHRSDSIASNASNFALDQQLMSELLTGPIMDSNTALEEEFALLADIETTGNSNLNKLSQSLAALPNSQSSQNSFGPSIASPDSVLDVDPKLRHRLNHALNYFPKDMQNTLIERLIDGVSDSQLSKPASTTDATTDTTTDTTADTTTGADINADADEGSENIPPSTGVKVEEEKV